MGQNLNLYLRLYYRSNLNFIIASLKGLLIYELISNLRACFSIIFVVVDIDGVRCMCLDVSTGCLLGWFQKRCSRPSSRDFRPFKCIFLICRIVVRLI